MNKYILFILAITSYGVSGIEVTAPYGLEWGKTKKEFEHKGIVFSDCETNISLTTCKTKKTIKPLAIAGHYYMKFFEGFGLQSVEFSGEEAEHLESREDNSTIFYDIKTALNSKYGKPTREINNERPSAFWDFEDNGAVYAMIGGVSSDNYYLILSHYSKSNKLARAKQEELEKAANLNVL
jgi:hypothetical protein